MTPLAHRITNELMLPIKRRTFVDNCGLLGKLDDIHCFEVTPVLGVAANLAFKVEEARRDTVGICDDLLFLPAPRTWVEFESHGGRAGFLLEQKETHTEVRAAFQHDDRFESAPRIDHFSSRPIEMDAFGWGFVAAVLMMINRPKIFGRRQHDPHRGLARKLLAGRSICGRFPLRAWTEIILEVTPPRDASNDEPSETQLTGQRALHFVRAHLGIRWGQLVLISACWRGDASLGIRQSRYLVVPPKSMEASA
ncbi:MAG TPA: hypothetical protein VM639_24345 [Dongiaceae bacterium]|nr:hypothetical protein [Dongiaceae bacterium]